MFFVRCVTGRGRVLQCKLQATQPRLLAYFDVLQAEFVHRLRQVERGHSRLLGGRHVGRRVWVRIEMVVLLPGLDAFQVRETSEALFFTLPSELLVLSELGCHLEGVRRRFVLFGDGWRVLTDRTSHLHGAELEDAKVVGLGVELQVPLLVLGVVSGRAQQHSVVVHRVRALFQPASEVLAALFVHRRHFAKRMASAAAGRFLHKHLSLLALAARIQNTYRPVN